MVKEAGHIECDGRNMVIRVRLLYQFELEMPSLSANLTSVAVVIDILGKEYRCAVAWPERLELLQYAQEFGNYDS